MDAFSALLSETKSKVTKRKIVGVGQDGPKKYRRRGDIAREEEEFERRKKEQDRRKKELAEQEKREKRRIKQENRERRRNGLPLIEEEKKADEEEEQVDEKELMPVWEVKRRLRILGHPITLFGETELERWKRLKEQELIAHERLGGSMGVGDLFRDIIKKEVEEDLQNADLLDGMGEEHKKEKMLKKERQMAKYTKKRERDSFKHDQLYALYFFKRMLYEWEDELERRDNEEKRTIKGKMDSATQKQCRQFIKPLFKLLKKKEVPADVFKHVLTIVVKCEERNYKKANEAYMMLAIGNAAWPMGVTMVLPSPIGTLLSIFF
uniref:Pre-mRNA-splicing factor 18 n=1 Tax=Lotharella oceanica TaxID=641309 RepID=A0A7S2XGY2_9EUKA|mmetsp:Transcript_4988/g.9896  ORF Transcript_4988/g.9896 Transcript_4988/m.9896 type:complete len:322 (+) Transcript_4988:28-993(+)